MCACVEEAGSFGVFQQKDLYSVFYIFCYYHHLNSCLELSLLAFFLPFSFARSFLFFSFFFLFASLFIVLLLSSSTTLKCALLVVFVSFLLFPCPCLPPFECAWDPPTAEFLGLRASCPRSRRFSCSFCPKSECLSGCRVGSSLFPAHQVLSVQPLPYLTPARGETHLVTSNSIMSAFLFAAGHSS